MKQLAGLVVGIVVSAAIFLGMGVGQAEPVGVGCDDAVAQLAERVDVLYERADIIDDVVLRRIQVRLEVLERRQTRH